MRKWNLFILLLVLVVGCGQSASETASYAPEYDVVEESTGGFAGDDAVDFEREELADGAIDLDIGRNQNSQVQQRLIIKTGNMSIDVDDIDVAIDDAISLATGIGGYIISQEVSGYDRFKSATLTLGVPVDQFENVMAALRDYGAVEAESATGEDVTEEYVDLNSRMTNLVATQERMRALLEEARNVEETLEVDRELRRIEEEMNIIQGRIKFLADRAAFSTITVRFSFQAEASVPEPETFNIGRTAQSAVVQLRDTAFEVADAAVYFGIVCGPWLLILLVLAWIGRGVFRRVRGRRGRNSAEIRSTTNGSTED